MCVYVHVCACVLGVQLPSTAAWKTTRRWTLKRVHLKRPLILVRLETHCNLLFFSCFNQFIWSFLAFLLRPCGFIWEKVCIWSALSPEIHPPASHLLLRVSLFTAALLDAFAGFKTGSHGEHWADASRLLLMNSYSWQVAQNESYAGWNTLMSISVCVAGHEAGWWWVVASTLRRSLRPTTAEVNGFNGKAEASRV